MAKEPPAREGKITWLYVINDPGTETESPIPLTPKCCGPPWEVFRKTSINENENRRKPYASLGVRRFEMHSSQFPAP